MNLIEASRIIIIFFQSIPSAGYKAGSGENRKHEKVKKYFHGWCVWAMKAENIASFAP